MSRPGNCRTRSGNTQLRQVTCIVFIQADHASHAVSASKVTSLNTFTQSHGKIKLFWSISESTNHHLTSSQIAVFVDYAETMLVRSVMMEMEKDEKA